MMSEPSKPEKPEKPGKGSFGAASAVSSLGTTMGVCIVGGFLLGRQLDIWFGTSPLWLILLTLLGVAASFKVMFDFAGKQ